MTASGSGQVKWPARGAVGVRWRWWDAVGVVRAVFSEIQPGLSYWAGLSTSHKSFPWWGLIGVTENVKWWSGL